MDESAENEFVDILSALQESGALERLILVGSWCLPVYRHVHGDAPEIPALRTTDLDFLVEDPKFKGEKIDVPKILESLGFSAEFDLNSKLVKYERRDLEIEFLSQRSRIAADVIPVPGLQLTAQILNYMEIARRYVSKVQYRGIPVKIPEMEAFVLHKVLVLPHRVTEAKRKKDAQTISGIASLISATPSMRRRICEIFDSFFGKWQKAVIKTARDNFPELLKILANGEN